MVKFTAQHEVWLEGEKYDAGEHEIAKPSKALARAIGSAHHAGAVAVAEGLEDGHIQSQEDGEAALRSAQGTANPVTGEWDGPWAAGNAYQYRLQKAQTEVAGAEYAIEQAGTSEAREERLAAAREALTAAENATIGGEA